MKLKKILLVLIISLIFFGMVYFVTSGSANAGDTCESNSDCIEGFTCHYNRCFASPSKSCSTNQECAGPYTNLMSCVNGECCGKYVYPCGNQKTGPTESACCSGYSCELNVGGWYWCVRDETITTEIRTTDIDGNSKTDFSPDEIVYIHGQGFSTNANIDIDITRPDSNVDSGSETTNSLGEFIYQYNLNGILGTYYVYASDGDNSAETTFTDVCESECGDGAVECEEDCEFDTDCPEKCTGTHKLYNFIGCVDCVCEYSGYQCVPGKCGAECDEDTDCSCPQDYCDSTTLVNYPEHGRCGTAGSEGCLCQIDTSSGGDCEPILIENDPICIAASTVTRSFSNNTPDQCSELTVSLTVDVNDVDAYYAIDEIVPTSWVISDPGTGDTTEAGHIKWVVIMGAADTVYQYNVDVPCDALGIYSFSGIYMFESDTEEQTILGETDVDVQAIGECQDDDDCDDLDNDYCDGDNVMHVEGVCNPTNECELGTPTLVEDCDDGLVCNGDETCVDAACVAGTPIDCSGNDIEGIATCDNDPDTNPFTWDYRDAFTSECTEPLGECTTGDSTITHTCDITNCEAQCDSDDDCTEGYCDENCECIVEQECGNGIVDDGEECDDSNNDDCDGCKGDCSRLDNVCGDEIVECGEECDDGNTEDGDGCSAECESEGLCEENEELVEFTYESKPDSAYIDDSTEDVSDQLCVGDNISVDANDGLTHYIYMNWDDIDVSDYDGAYYFDLMLYHKEAATLIKVQLKNQFDTWIDVCDPPESSSFTWDTCDLMSYLDILSEVSVIELRVVVWKSGTCHEYLRCAKLKAKLYNCEPTICCGDGNVDPGEECELPNTFNNPYCPQTPQEDCLGNKLGTRDEFGDCDETCGCIPDEFEYECVPGECDAECDGNDDCEPNACELTFNDYCNDTKLVEYDDDKILDSTTVTDSCENTCEEDCLCTDCQPDCPTPETNTYCVPDVCGAECEIDDDCDDSDEYTIDYCLEDCTCEHEEIPTCPTDAKVKILFDKAHNYNVPFENKTFARTYVGPDKHIYGNGEYIDLVNETDKFIVDDGLVEDVHGLALERGLGWIRVVLHGSHPSSNMLEYVDAYVIFDDAYIIDFTDDSDNGNPLENQGDGIHSDYWNHDPSDASQDEVNATNETNKADVFMRVNVADDGFILYYECEELCGNGVVDEGEECDDGNDIDDDDCSNDCKTVYECNDGKDNDCDGLIDYPDDPFCLSPEDDQELGNTECDDCIDNDNDGLIDFNDPGCKVSRFDDSEYNSITYGCSDDIDNDGDGLIDRDDPGCYSGGSYSPRDNNEQDRYKQCRDYFDNDGDGSIDLEDDDCVDRYDSTEG